MDERSNTNVLWWAVPASVVILLAILAMLGGAQPSRVPPPRSTYDASPEGVRAVYLLLDGLDYKVVQSRRLGAGRVRWVLFPATEDDSSSSESPIPVRSSGQRRSAREEAEALDRWVRDGGTLLLADESAEFAKLLGLRVTSTPDAATSVRIQDAARSLELAPGPVQLKSSDRPTRTWPERGEPLVSVYRRERGEIWFVQRPGIFRNERLRDADNAQAICMLADATSRNGAERIEFDEFFHGLRERPGPVQLLLQPPALWVTLQGLVALALLLWRFLPRFGPLLELATPRRRSKEEFLDAMAYLLARKGAYAEALVVVRDALARDLQEALGLPATTPWADLAAQAVRRRPGLDEEKLRARPGP